MGKMIVFESQSIERKNIRLTETQQLHILQGHKECAEQTDKMILTIKSPDVIYFDPAEEVYHYLRFFSDTPVTEKFMLLIVKHVDNEGFIITAFFISKIKLKGKVKVYAKENND